MPGLDPQLVSHKLKIKEGCKLVKQAPRNFKPELEVQIKEETQKLLDVGFIKPVQHLTWLANIVPVKKKNGQIRCCIDFRDLNKACPKDEFFYPILTCWSMLQPDIRCSVLWMASMGTIR